MHIPEPDVAEERTVSSERLYEGRTINLRIDRVSTDGEQSTHVREIVEHSGAAVIVAQPDPEHVVLVRQWRHAAGLRMWEIPAGKLDPGETPQQCAARELREETGYAAGTLTPMFSGYSAPGFCAEILHFFHATELVGGESDPDEGEEILMRSFSLTELERAMHTGELLDVKTLLGVSWLLSRRARVQA
jgi:ADP-ribose pyrophosphatase